MKFLRALPVHVLAPLLSGAAVLTALTGEGVIWLLSTVLSLAVLLATPTRSVLSRIPYASLLPAASILSLSLLSSLAHLPLLHSLWATRSELALLSLFPLVLLRSKRVRVPLAYLDEALVSLPAFAVLLAALSSLWTSLKTSASWFLLPGDSLTHFWFVADLQRRGYLDYSTQTYPRAWHALAATLSSDASSSLPTPATFPNLLQTSAALELLAYALFVLASSLVALRLSRYLSLSRWSHTLAGCLVGITLLNHSFFVWTFAYGFVDTTISATLLACLALALTDHLSSRGLLTTLSILILLLAHTFPPLVLVAAVVWLGTALPLHTSRSAVCSLLLALATAILSLPPFLALLERAPSTLGSAEGVHDPLALSWAIPLALATLALLFARRLPLLPRLLPLLATGLALLVALVSHASPLAYYPTKILWHAMALAVPLLWVGAAWLATLLAKRVHIPDLPVLRLLLPVLALSPTLALVYSAYLPLDGVVEATWSDPSSAVRALQRLPDAPSVTATWHLTTASDRPDSIAARLVPLFTSSSTPPAPSADDPRGVIALPPRPTPATCDFLASTHAHVLSGTTEDHFLQAAHCSSLDGVTWEVLPAS